jgi:hypothetical protein
VQSATMPGCHCCSQAIYWRTRTQYRARSSSQSRPCQQRDTAGPARSRPGIRIVVMNPKESMMAHQIEGICLRQFVSRKLTKVYLPCSPFKASPPPKLILPCHSDSIDIDVHKSRREAMSLEDATLESLARKIHEHDGSGSEI